MPTISLTDRKIASLKATGEQRDFFDRSFPGFGVRVNQGRKTFILMYRTAEKKLRRQTLGVYGLEPPGITVATARAEARKEVDKTRSAAIRRLSGSWRRQTRLMFCAPTTSRTMRKSEGARGATTRARSRARSCPRGRAVPSHRSRGGIGASWCRGSPIDRRRPMRTGFNQAALKK